jgi:hypothetical protein
MALHVFHDLTLEVQQDQPDAGAELERLLQNLSFVPSPALAKQPCLRLTVHWQVRPLDLPAPAREVFRAEGLCGLAYGDDFYLTEGTSLLHLQPGEGQGTAQLVPAFVQQPQLLRQQFWAVGLLKLLRPLGLYGLHAAGMVTHPDRGILLVGGSGSGKSTLTIGLVQQGWSYLSDDALLLRQQPEGVEALAFRKPFSIDADVAAAYAELPLGEAGEHPSGKRKRRVDIQSVYADQYRSRCRPSVLLFPRIVAAAQSTVCPLNRSQALRYLLVHSGPHLFDRHTMAPHLETLRDLVQQTVRYELRAGRDLYTHPSRLVHLLYAAEGGTTCLV